MKKIMYMLGVLLLGAALAGCGGEESDDIKLGFLGAATGPTANYGIPGEKGMRLAIDEINASGGILGRQLTGIYEDNKGQTSEITAIAQRYITRDHVAAMIGDTTTGLTKAAAKIAQDNKTVLFSPGATGDGVVEIGDYIYRNTLLDIFAAPAVVEWMIQDQGWENFAVITSLNNGYSTALTPIFEQAITERGGNIVITDTINDGETDFTAQITKLKSAGADVLVFTGYYTEAALLMNEAAKKELDITMVGGDGLYGLDLARLGGSAVEEKVIFYCGFSTDQPSEETDRFLETYRSVYGEEPDMFSAQYYDAVYIIAQAMDQAGSAVPEDYKAYLNGLSDYPGVSGNTTFREDREPIKSPVFLLTVRDGQFALVNKIPVNAAAAE
jgi:branched-chain amino acid transport system substrate-binding protein